MTWSYSLADLGTDEKDQVRFLIGDTLSNAPLLADEEITFAIGTRATIYGAAAECCRSLSSRFAREADVVQQELRTAYSAKSRAYGVRAIEFENKAAANGGGLPYAGGISIFDKQQQEANNDRVPPQFNPGMQDNYIPVGQAGNELLSYPQSVASSE